MILNHIGVAIAYQSTESRDEICLLARSWRIDRHGQPTIITHGNHEDTTTVWVERGRFQVELQPVQVVIEHDAKVNASRKLQKIYDRTNADIDYSQVVNIRYKVAKNA